MPLFMALRAPQIRGTRDREMKVYLSAMLAKPTRAFFGQMTRNSTAVATSQGCASHGPEIAGLELDLTSRKRTEHWPNRQSRSGGRLLSSRNGLWVRRPS